MKRLSIKRNLKVNENVKNTFKIIMIGVILALIYIATPHCTQATKNFATWLYEMDEEFINRFWMGALSLTSMTTILFCKPKNQK